MLRLQCASTCDGKIDDQPLSEEAHLGAIDLLNVTVVRGVEGGFNLTKVIRVFFRDRTGYPLTAAIYQHCGGTARQSGYL